MLEHDAIIDHSEVQAIDDVAGRQGPVTDIQEVHMERARNLFEERGMVIDDNSIEESVVERAEEREDRFRPNVRVNHLPGDIAGVQHDEDRRVEIDAALVHSRANRAEVEEVDQHEFRHTQQAAGNDMGMQVVEYIDGDRVHVMLALGSREYREADAMQFAGSRFTSAQYHSEYLHPVQEVERYLNHAGEDGARLVEDAGLRGKVLEIREAILRASSTPSPQP